MALTPDEAKELRDMLKEIEELSIKLKLNIDTTNLQDIENNAKEIKNLFGILNDRWEDLTANASIASEAFRNTVKALSNQNIGLNTSVRVYKSFIPIADKILAYQRGSGELTIKDTDNFKKKIELRKIELKQSETSLQTEEKESQKKQDSLNRELAALKRKATLNAYEKSERKRIEAALAREESHHQQIKNSIEQNNALLNDQDEAFKNLELSISEIARTLNQDLVKNLDKSFSNLINDVQTTEDGIKKVVKSFGVFENITRKIQDHQSGTNVLSEKDAKNLLNKAESERKRLANTQRLLQIEQKALEAKEKANQLDLNNLTARKEELKLASESGTITQKEGDELEELNKKELALLETRKDITSEITLNANLQKKTADIVKGQDENYQKLIQQIKAAKKEAENMRKALGLSGAAVDGIGKAFNKLGLGGLTTAMGLDDAKDKMKEVADRITDGGKKSAGLVGQFRILGAGLKEIGANMIKHLTDPLTIVTGLITGIVSGVKGLISLFEQTAKFNGDIAKTFGVSAAESAKIGDNLRNAAGSDFFMTTEESRKAFDIMASASGTINSNFSDPKAVSAMNNLVTYAGRSVEASEGLFRMGKLNNMEADDMEKSLRGQLTLLQKNNKLRINESQAIEMVGKASATVRMNLGSNPKKLADAAFYASKLGMTLDEIASAAEQTLNFESAIQNQLEYQVLTGKEINIDAYQQAAASGDTAKAAEEMNRILEEQGDSIKGNFFAQEALAKTLGISREQMMKSLEFQKVQKKVGGDIAEIEKAINAEMANGLSLEEASAKVGEKSYDSIVAQNQSAQAFTRTIGEIKEAFTNALASSDGFKNLFNKENIKKYVKYITTELLPKAAAFGRTIGNLIDPKNIEKLVNKFNEIKDTLILAGKIVAGLAILKLAAGIKNLMGRQRGSSPMNPLYVTPTGGGMGDGGGMDASGPGGPGKTMSRRQRNINRALKVAGLGLAAYTAYNALSGKNAEDYSKDEVQSYMQQTGIQDEGQAREQMASQQYQTGSKAGDLGVAGIEAASAASINTGKSVAATSPKPLAKNQKAAYQAARSQGVPAQQAMNQARNVKPEKGMFGKAFDFMSDMGSKAVNAISDATGITKAKDWFAKNIKSSLAPLMKSAKNTLKPVLKTLPFVGPALDLLFMGMNVNDIAKQQNVSPEELYSQIGKTVIGSGAGMLGGAIAATGVSSLQAIGIPGWLLSGAAYAGGSWLGNTIGSAISDYVGGPALGKAIMDTFYEDAPKSQPQQVQDGSLDPNGGPVVSTFQKGELTPVMQGIKEDNVYMTTNKPVAQVQDGVYGRASQDNSAVLAAIKELAGVFAANSNKEITLEMNGQKVGKVLTPIMTNPLVRQMNIDSVLI